MPDGQSGVPETFDYDVNVVSFPLVAPIAVTPQYERPAYVPENYKWGSAAVGTSGGTITWAVVSAGQTYPSSEYTSAATAIGSVFMPTIRAAFSRWDEVGNFTFVESSNPMTADIVVMFDELSGEGSSTIGLAHTYYSAGVVRDSYISFDIGRRYRLTDGTVQIVGSPTSSSTSDFYTLVLHEVGHALGLDHEDDFPTVMGSFQNSSITDLTSDEINGIRYLYGTPGGAGTDDWGGTTATTGAIIVGASVIGNIETAGDSDWFRVTLTAGVTYQFDMLGGSSLTDPFLNLRNSSGVVVGSDDDSGDGLNARLVYTPTSSGVYFVDARSASASGTGFYGVLVTQSSTSNPNPSDDYAGSTSTTGTIAVGGTVNGNIEVGDDRDWFRVTLAAGTTYRVDLNGGTLADPLLYIRNSSGTSVASDDDSGTGLNASLSYTPTTTGTYYIDAQGATLSGTGTYTLSLTQTSAADDYTASTSTTGSVTVGGTATGRIETGGDRDWFRVSLTAGATYRFDVRGIDTSGGTLSDPYLTLRDSNGTLLGSDDDSGTILDAQLSYTATTSGTYYVEARASGSTGTGTYTVGVTQTGTGTGGPDDFGQTASTAGILSVGQIRTGTFENNQDQDWFAATLTAGTPYHIQVRGRDTGGGTMVNPSLSIYTSTGLIRFDSDSGFGADAFLSFTPTSTGIYYIAPEALFAGTGTYTVQLVEAIGGDDAWNSALSSVVLPVGLTFAGNIGNSFDTDYIHVDMVAGTTYQIDVRGAASGVGTLSDPYLSILKPNTFSADKVDNDSGTGADAQLIYTATVTGRHDLAVEAIGGALGSYVVSVVPTTAPPAQDYPATVATTGVVNVGGTLSSTIDQAADVDWIRVNLTAGTLYRFDARGSASGGGTLADPALQLLNSSGTVLASDSDSGTGVDSRIMFQATTSGSYYLAARSNSSTATGTYTIAATASPDDYAANTGTTGTLTVGGTAHGLLETSGDRDWFRVSLTANTTYTISLSGTALGNALRWTESSFYVRNGSGFQLATASSSGLGASAVLTYTASTTGTYIIDTQAYSSGVGSYTVSIATGRAQQADMQPAIGEETDLSAADLAAIMAPPAIMLDEPPVQMARSITVLAEDPLSVILTPPPANLFQPPTAPQNPFMANTPLDQLFQQQLSNSYNLLPF
ncbi:MAG: pre-peptidase C-terminal domain-containing protein [Proteobacteria bacterium]|nr:pre-peptidase C-terminal domain-containing protein [Pseudomonadota bacterium]